MVDLAATNDLCHTGALAAHASDSEPAQRLGRLCSAILGGLQSGLLSDAHFCGELNDVLANSLRQFSSEFQKEVEVLDAAIAHLRALAGTRLLDCPQQSANWLDDWTRKRNLFGRLLVFFRELDDRADGHSSASMADTQAPPSLSSLHDLAIPARLQPLTDSVVPEASNAGGSQSVSVDEATYRFSESTATAETAEIRAATNETVEIEPTDESAARAALEYCNAGDVFRRRRDYEKAEALYGEAIQLNSQCQPAFVRRGLLYLLAGVNDAAIDDLTTSLALKEDDTEALCLRGDAHARAGNLEEAVRDYRSALALDDSLHKTRFNLGVALRRLENWAEAATEFARLIDVWPEHAPVHYNRGLLNVQYGRWDDAVADFRTAMRLKPDYADAKEQLRLLQQRVRGQAEAEQAAAAPPSEAAVPAETINRVSIICPGCGTMGLLNWNRLDKVVICQQCRRNLGIRPDGQAVEVARTCDGNWVELAKIVQRKRTRRKWLSVAIVTALLIPALGLSLWKVAGRTKDAPVSELPKDLPARAELFANAWLCNDVPLMRRLTAPANERQVFPWYNKHRPPIAREEGIRKSLPATVKIETEIQPLQDGWRKVTIYIVGLQDLGAATTFTELVTTWREQNGVWYFQPPTR